jgi:hypothetical protein
MPGGMFPAEGMNMFVLSVTAIGNDFYAQAGGATIVGTIRSKWTAMKMNMAGMQPPPAG